MYGQMTAGSWIYIGTPGDPAGHLRVLRRDRPAPLRRLARRDDHAHRRARRHGRRPAAGGHDERRRRALHRGRPRRASARRLETRYLDEEADDLEDAIARCARAKARAPRRSASALVRQRRRRRPRAAATAGFAADIVTDQTSAHDPLVGYVPGRALARRGRRPARAATPTSYVAPRRGRRWPRHCARWSASRTPAPRSSTTATACAREAQLGGFERAFDYPGFVPAYIRPLFCEGKGPFRWVALSGDPADIAATDRAVLEEFPERRGARAAGSGWPASGSPSRVCRRASAGSATASGTGSGCASTRWSAAASVSAPIVIGRDHLDSGSVASPYRETEAMADGSDAIADWPLLNALVNTAVGRDLGQHPPRRRGRHRPLDPRRHGLRRRRHRRSPAEKLDRVLTDRSRDGRHPPRRRRLRAGDRGRRRARRPDPDGAEPHRSVRPRCA